MTLFQAIVLGIVQGLTEFIPISSTAHLVFAARAAGLYEGVEATLRAEQTTATIAVVQLGTLLAVLAYFWRDILHISESFLRDHLALINGQRARSVSKGSSLYQSGEPIRDNSGRWLSPEAWLGWLVIIGSIPVAVFGLVFRKQIEGTLTKNLWVIATMMIVVAILLGIAELVGKRTRSLAELGAGDALAVGFAQALALLPGASRSGSTIMAGLFAGQLRETAARFSFLLSIPAIAASGIFELRAAIVKLPSDSYLSLAVATMVSGIVGYASIWFLLRFLRAHSTGIFIFYRLIVGGLILVALSAGYLSASV
ncbi:MAG TPA: undecaprenyl-diphosphate phosphatase [Pyrinomonadaceae bacterium]|nr:undecaprenyl-diphosphate phosphatase [Pyrinomonadaceae bacterium]